MLSILVPLRQERWRRFLLTIGCWLLSGMIIFVGDIANLPPTMIIFLITVYLGCDGSKLQKTTVALMIASTAFAFNALTDNYIRIDYIRINIYWLLPRVLFWLVLYLLMRHYGPCRNYELTPPLWRLLLLLTATPLGIVLSLVLLQSPSYDSSSASMLCDFVLLLIAVLSFIGLLTLEARAEKGLLVCRISNPIKDTITLEKGLPATTKQNNTHHGYGLRSLQEIIERHHGQLEIKTLNGMFTLFFYLPFNTNK